MSELKSVVSQPAITNWLSGALQTLIQLESRNKVAQGMPASMFRTMEGTIETTIQPVA